MIMLTTVVVVLKEKEMVSRGAFYINKYWYIRESEPFVQGFNIWNVM